MLEAQAHDHVPAAGEPFAGGTTAQHEHALAECLRVPGAMEGRSEVEALAANPSVRKAAIAPDWQVMLGEARRLGRVRTVARNAHAIHKSWGSYGALRGGEDVGLVINGGIDLRMFYRAWSHAYVVEAASGDTVRLSLQIFDDAGDAVQKVFPETAEGESALREWAGRFGISAGAPAVRPAAAGAPERPDASIDVKALLDAWQDLKDVHHFRAMIARHGAGRTQALRLAQGRFTEPAARDALARALTGAHAGAVPVMVFVANRGIVQIHSGTVGTAERRDGWLHLTDPDFHLHVREAGIAQSWIVTKPTSDGPVTALECYDTRGEAVLQMFGVRQEGSAENPAWQALAHGLARAS